MRLPSFIAFSIGVTLAALLLLLMGRAVPVHAGPSGTPDAPTVDGLLVNADYECTTGYYTSTNAISETIFAPNEWQLTILDGAPIVHSARTFFTGSCSGTGHVERISGIDSVVVRAQDLETPPQPGKPFDVALHQQVSVVSGTAYSLSGWMLSLCGGSAVPSDCPNNIYIAKMLGIDPTGDVDPASASVAWAENRDNFVDDDDNRIGWRNLRIAKRAQNMTMTVFARLHSPFQHHGNHGFMDALSLMPAPTAQLAPLPPVITGTNEVTLTWQATMPVEIASIPAGTYQTLVDLQFRRVGAAMWASILEGQQGSGGDLTFSVNCLDESYEFRLRARAEQPPAPPDGAQPNQRYPGVWTEPAAIFFAREPISGTVEPAGPFAIYAPFIINHREC